MNINPTRQQVKFHDVRNGGEVYEVLFHFLGPSVLVTFMRNGIDDEARILLGP